MKSRWLGRNVDPMMLKAYIEDFFQKRGFVTKPEESKPSDVFTIIASAGEAVNAPRRVLVKVSGHPGDFMIDMDLDHSGFTKLIPLLGLIGLGGVVLRRTRDQEFLEKLEGDFWLHVEDAVSTLAAHV